MKILGIEHLGIAVDSINSSAPFWKHVLNIAHSSTESVEKEKVIDESEAPSLDQNENFSKLYDYPLKLNKKTLMNILILGSGGREHAFALKIADSKLTDKLYVAPGNSGTQQIATNIPLNINDFEQVKKKSLELGISMIIVGPEAPLVNGIHDFFAKDKETNSIAIIGPKQNLS